MITNREIASIDRTIYSGYQASWPPPPPAKNKGIFYCGFPAAGTRVPSRNEVVFGAFAGSGVASAVNECDVLTQVEREFLEPALGEGIPPENYDFGGNSGGPMLYVVETKSGLRFNALAGIIYAGPNTSDDPNEAIPGFELRAPSAIHSRRRLSRTRIVEVCLQLLKATCSLKARRAGEPSSHPEQEEILGIGWRRHSELGTNLLIDHAEVRILSPSQILRDLRAF
jgi:hypothetical protein